VGICYESKFVFLSSDDINDHRVFCTQKITQIDVAYMSDYEKRVTVPDFSYLIYKSRVINSTNCNFTSAVLVGAILHG
jgi:hypothetical protein